MTAGGGGEPRPSPPPSSESLRVLLVEDAAADQWLLSEMLRSRGHYVIACDDAESGWEVFVEESPSLILLDLVMPGMGGLELCRKIRAHPMGRDAIIVVVTARRDPDVLARVLEAGADDYLTKPVDVPLLNVRLAVAEGNVQRQLERRRTREELAAKTRELETLFENLDQVFFSVDTRRNRLIQVSPGAERVLGFPLEDVFDEHTAWWKYLLPPPPERSAAMARLESGNTLIHGYPAGRKEGAAAAEVEAEAGSRWLEAVLKPELDRDGELVRIDGVISDITERHRTQRQLAARNQELATLYRLTEITLAPGGLDEIYARVLREITSVTGFPVAFVEHYDPERERLVPRASQGVELPDGRSEGRALSETLSGRAVRDQMPVVESHLGRQDAVPDALRELGIRSWAAFPMLVEGQVLGTLSLAHTDPVEPDTRLLRWGASMAGSLASLVDRLSAVEALRESEQRYRRLASRLQQANEELESFAYSVSHDLRAPLRTMQGFAHTLLQNHRHELGEEARDYLNRIIRSGQQSEELISDLLAYSRLSFESLELQKVDLGGVVEAAREQVAGDLAASGAQVEVEEPLPRAHGHRMTLVQVVANLLSNAVKFVPEGRTPRIAIRSEVRGDRVRLWVEDNGIGIPEEKRDRVFRVFERLGGDLDGKPGTGIGLAIVRRGVERIGGSVGVEARSPHGSAFWIELPRDGLPAPSPWSIRRDAAAED